MFSMGNPGIAMPEWLGKCLCVVAILGVFDGHLMLAQSWAWMTMARERTPQLGNYYKTA